MGKHFPVMNAYDLPALFRYREHLAAAAAMPDSTILPLRPVTGRAIALFPGTFNPPTTAHLHLAERALATDFDTVIFLLPVAPAGKQMQGMIAEDRLAVLELIAPPGCGVAVASQPLYVDQAVAAAKAFPQARCSFIAGSDKLRQILDRSWYSDGEASIERLFANADLHVSPRGESADAVAALLEEPENRRFAHRVAIMPLHPSVGDLSSTRVRGLLGAGAESAGLVPAVVAAYCAQAGIYDRNEPNSSLDAYSTRARLIGMLHQAGDTDADLAALIRDATSPGARGEALREAIERSDVAALAQIGGR